jgi:serine/threonine protein phosphatase PrpC
MRNGVPKTNQDSVLLKNKILGDCGISMMAVFDGHGSEGHLVSKFLVANLIGKILKGKKNLRHF